MIFHTSNPITKDHVRLVRKFRTLKAFQRFASRFATACSRARQGFGIDGPVEEVLALGGCRAGSGYGPGTTMIPLKGEGGPDVEWRIRRDWYVVSDHEFIIQDSTVWEIQGTTTWQIYDQIAHL
jgi:hypothetical protein